MPIRPRPRLFHAAFLAFALGGVAFGPGAAHAAVTVGAKAPPFALPVAAVEKAKGDGGPGAPIALSSLLKANAFTVVLFVATRCPYSNAYNNRMRQLATKFRKQGVGFVGINSNVTEPPEEVARHKKRNKLPFPIVKDAGSKIADAFGATKTPEVYVVDKGGTIVYHGRIDENFEKPDAVEKPDLNNALVALLRGQPVERAVTKAFGCSIKRPQ